MSYSSWAIYEEYDRMEAAERSLAKRLRLAEERDAARYRPQPSDPEMEARLLALEKQWEEERMALKKQEAERRAQEVKDREAKIAHARDVFDRLWAERSKAMDQILAERDRQWKAKAPSQYMVDRAIAAIARAIGCDPWNEIVQCALHQHIVMGMTVAEAAVYARNNLAMWQEPVPMSDEERQARNILRLP